MKKGIIMSLLLMFLLTGCISVNGEVKGTLFSNPPKDPEVHIDDFRVNCQTAYNQDFDEYTMMYRVTNNSKFPVIQYQCSGTFNSGQNQTDLICSETLMPGDTSTVQETSDITSLNDMEITKISYEYKDDQDRTVWVDYDAKLEKYHTSYVIND